MIDPNLYVERLREIMMKNNQLSVQIGPKCPNDRKVMKELHYKWKSKERYTVDILVRIGRTGGY